MFQIGTEVNTYERGISKSGYGDQRKPLRALSLAPTAKKYDKRLILILIAKNVSILDRGMQEKI
jgi:hypothetical protein